MARKKKITEFENIDIAPQTVSNEELKSEPVIEESEQVNEQKEVKAKRITVSKGLTSEEVAARVAQGKVNIVTNKNAKTVGQIIVGNVLTVFNLLNLLIAAALIVAQSYKNLLFVFIIIINTVIGIIQELKAKKTVESLSLISAPSVQVIRNGKKEYVKADELVSDDIMFLDAGKQICADSIVRKGVVEVNESMLTGEADSIVKKPGGLLYSGSFIVSGDCYAKVERVGDQNYIQQLASQAKRYTKPKSEIMHSLQILIRVITVIVVILGTVLFLNNYYVATANDWRQSIISTAGSMIGMIPSGLFLMTSISLAYGVIKLGRNNTLVKDLYCIEMLARVDMLCLDKTGTITDGTMRVRDVIEYPTDINLSVKQIISMVLGNVKETNATAVALNKKFGQVKKASTKAIVPFSSVRKYMAAYFENDKMSYIIGAPEFVMPKNYKESSISFDVERYAKQGLRVLLVAASNTKITNPEQIFNEVTPLALITIEDVIRKDAAETIQYFKDSNVNVKVISGDNPLTVSKIAMRAGVDNANHFISLDGMGDEEVARSAEHYTVFGRVSPKQKQILIKKLKQNGHTVAMTGDGVNDILAMKESDCSIAMANGSEATRNVAHLVLLDSNFSSMPLVVKEGRRVINNIKRVATMFLTKTIFSFLLTLVVIISKNIYPIQTVQLMLFDWFVVSIPSFYLALEANNTQIKGKFLRDVLVSALPGAVLIVINYIVIIGIGSIFPEGSTLTNQMISTMTILSTMAVGFMVLYRTCRPFNNNRRTMYIIMLLLFFVCLFGLGDLMELVSFKTLGVTATLLVICIAQYSIPLYMGFCIGIEKLKERPWRAQLK